MEGEQEGWVLGFGVLFRGGGDGFPLFIGELMPCFRAGDDGLGINACSFSRMDGGDDDTGILAIHERDAETLVAPDLFEWIESDDIDFMDALESESIEAIGNFEEFLDFLVEYFHVFFLLEED